MTTLDTHELAAIDVSAYLPPRRLTREECTTPQLRLEYIAQWLEDGALAKHGIDQFKMTKVINRDCGTACCIAGALCVWFGDADCPTSREAANLAGLANDEDRQMLFFGHVDGTNDYAPLMEIGPAWAARCIRKYQRTGIVDWAGTRDAP